LALEKFLGLETDDARSETAAALAEVLRCGAGMEGEGDYCEYAFIHQFRDAEPVNALFTEWGRERRLIGLAPDKDNRPQLLMILGFDSGAVLTGSGPEVKVGRLLGYVVPAGNLMRFWGPAQDDI